MSDTKYCQECGAEHDATATYCPECGHTVGESAGEPKTTESDEGEDTDGGIAGKIPLMKPGSTIRNAFVGILWVIVILAVIGALAGGDTGGDDDGKSATTHSIGETFTVGEGDQSIEYTVTNVETSSTVGGSFTSEEADGEFVIIDIEMKNVGDESFSLSSSVFSLSAGGNEYDTDDDAILAFDNNVIYEQLDPEVTKEGKLVFDVPEDAGDRSLIIEPAGTFSSADEHKVEL
jgi:hypothetical protein